MKITISAFSLLFAFSALAQSTNNLRPGSSALMLDTNSLIVAPTNFWAANAAGLNAVVTGGGGGGGATNGIQQASGHGTNTSLVGATIDSTSTVAGQTGAAVAAAASAVAAATPNNTASALVQRDANGGFQNGHGTFSSIASQNEAVLARATSGTDNAITVQNTDNGHYSAMRFVDLANQETGAIGFGNYGAPFYMGMDYLESYGDGYGFYFTEGGHVCGGLQRATKHFVWSNDTSSTDTNMPIVFDVAPNGTVTNSGDIFVGGGIYQNQAYLGSGGTPIVTATGHLDGRFIPNDSALGDIDIRTAILRGGTGVAGSTVGPAVVMGGGTGLVALSVLDYGLTISSIALSLDLLTIEPPGASTPRMMLKQNLPFYWSTSGWGSLGTPASPVGYGFLLTNAVATEVVTNTLTAGNITTSGGITNSALTASTFVYADANKKLASGSFGSGLSMTSGTMSLGTVPAASLSTQTVVGTGGSSQTITWAATLQTDEQITLSANLTITFAGAADGETLNVTVINTSGNYTVTWPSLKWAAGTAPTQTIGAHTDFYTFHRLNGVVYGSVVQNF